MRFNISARSIENMTGGHSAPIALGRILEDTIREAAPEKIIASYNDSYTWAIEATIEQEKVVNLMLDIERKIRNYKESGE